MLDPLINFFQNFFSFIVISSLLMLPLGIGFAVFVILLIVIAVWVRKKKSKLKHIPIALLILIVIGIGFISNQTATKWHRELYVPERSAKEYTVAGEKIIFATYPQTRDISDVKTYTGPYKMRVTFEKGIFGDEKEITIHNMTVKSNDGSTIPMNLDKFPLKIRTIMPKSKDDLISYTHLFRSILDFDFERREEIFVTLDVEVKKNEKAKKEEITLKLLPVLDKSSRVYPPSV